VKLEIENGRLDTIIGKLHAQRSKRLKDSHAERKAKEAAAKKAEEEATAKAAAEKQAQPELEATAA
jgi:hypothetical protein